MGCSAGKLKRIICEATYPVLEASSFASIREFLKWVHSVRSNNTESHTVLWVLCQRPALLYGTFSEPLDMVVQAQSSISLKAKTLIRYIIHTSYKHKQ